MGVFSRNESYNLGMNYDIPVDESYTYPEGINRALEESAKNDLALFSALIARDFEESAMIQEGYDGFSMEVITEGVGDLFKKVKEIILKLVAKVKGIFKSFMAKFDAVVIKDNKTYFEKYRKVVNGAGINWSNFKCKYSAPKNGGFVGSYNDKFGTAEFGDAQDEFGSWSKYKNSNVTIADMDKAIYDLVDDDKLKIKMLNGTGTSINDVADFEKEFHEMFYDDPEESDEFSSMKSFVEPIMASGNKHGSIIKKNTEILEKTAKGIVRDYDKMGQEVLKAIGNYKNLKDDDVIGSYQNRYATNKDIDDTNKNIDDEYRKTGKHTTDINYNKIPDNDKITGQQLNKDTDIFKTLREKAMKFANAQTTMANIFQDAVLTVNRAVLKEITFETKQAKSVYSAMAAYALNTKNKTATASESTSLVQFAQEAAEYEFDSDFELA